MGQQIDARGANDGTSANSWQSTLFIVKSPTMDWFNNNVRKLAPMFIHRDKVDVASTRMGAPSSYMHANTQHTAVVMQHLAAVNYDLMRNRIDPDYPKTGYDVSQRYWFCGVADSTPAATLQDRPDAYGERVNVVNYGWVAVMDVWSGWLKHNRKLVKERRVHERVYVPNVLSEGTHLWFIIRQVGIDPDTTNYNQTLARIEALAGRGANPNALGARDVWRNANGVPVRIINDPALPVSEQDARDARVRDNTRPYHWVIEPLSLQTNASPPDELLQSERKGGPMGYAIRVGWAHTPISSMPKAVDTKSIHSIVRPSVGGQWNNGFSSISTRHIMICPYRT